jgi:hypothetical protein
MAITRHELEEKNQYCCAVSCKKLPVGRASRSSFRQLSAKVRANARKLDFFDILRVDKDQPDDDGHGLQQADDDGLQQADDG